uniref:Monoamine oxidase B n=1 Tax=Mus musculus TaxID=10090 RepID=G3UZM5_MOUSE
MSNKSDVIVVGGGISEKPANSSQFTSSLWRRIEKL